MRNKPSPADIDLAINQAKHGGWINHSMTSSAAIRGTGFMEYLLRITPP